ncbi:MAG: phospholipase D-like domain-containing protein [Wenzhouxiangellaceae bacterium]
MLVYQSPQFPNRILSALSDLMGPDVTAIKVCAAYTSLGGSNLFMNQVNTRINKSKDDHIPISLITSLDYGITEPAALKCWHKYAFSDVYIRGEELLKNNNLIPESSAFHPKMYIFERGNNDETSVCTLVGSANLTTRGLTVNSEIAWQSKSSVTSEVNDCWAGVMSSVVPLSTNILETYSKLHTNRYRSPTEAENEPVNEPRSSDADGLFAESGIDPLDYEVLWVQTRNMSGGAASQAEMPRGAYRFFAGVDPDHNTTNNQVQVLKEIEIRLNGHIYSDKRVTWHPNNGMERLNLPSHNRTGIHLENSMILLRRIDGMTYELSVLPWESDIARAICAATEIHKKLFHVAKNKTDRLCGLLPNIEGLLPSA